MPEASRLDNLPSDTRERTKKIIWSNVSIGYQPQLTGSWFHLMQVFREEVLEHYHDTFRRFALARE